MSKIFRSVDYSVRSVDCPGRSVDCPGRSVDCSVRPVDCSVRSVDYSVRSVAAVDSKKCYATGRGVQPKGVRVADKAVFKVHTQGAGDGDLKVQVSQPPPPTHLLRGVSAYRLGDVCRLYII